MRFYWLTAGITTVACAIVTVAWTSSSHSSNQPADTGGVATSGFQGQWQGVLSGPGYGSSQVELDLRSAGPRQVAGQFVSKASGCTSDVSGTVTGTTLTLSLDRRWITGHCGGQFTAEVQWLGVDSVRFTRGGGAAPMSGDLARVG
ncbi:hypothetical protein [Amycolatopsis sp. NPDC004079]|uniref:hypothetical protein n=1 Tax=Amycolatopsis sp. NPDC004079 TaxID=3154549 RepID=UPI0033A6122C